MRKDWTRLDTASQTAWSRSGNQHRHVRAAVAAVGTAEAYPLPGTGETGAGDPACRYVGRF